MNATAFVGTVPTCKNIAFEKLRRIYLGQGLSSARKLAKTTGENRRKRGVATRIVRLERASCWQAIKSRSFRRHTGKLRVSEGVVSPGLGFKEWEGVCHKYTRTFGVYERLYERRIDDFSKVTRIYKTLRETCRRISVS